MSDKKHIDRLFQEKFKDFEVTPRDEVWDSIEAKLNKKKKKQRLIPIWWRYAGMAALLALLVAVASLYFNNSNSNLPENQVVETEASEETNQKQQEDSLFSSTEKTNYKITESEDAVANTSEDTELNHQTVNTSEGTKNSDGKIFNSNSSLSNPVANTDHYISSNDKSVKANKAKKPLEKSDNDYKEKHKSHISNNNAIAEVVPEESVLDENHAEKSSKEIHNNTGQKNNGSLARDNAIAEVRLNQKDNTINNVGVNESDSTIPSNSNENNLISLAPKQDQNESESSEDSLEENLDLTIEKAIAEVNEINEEEKFNRWSIAPNAAPVYFNTLGEGSSIDPQFNSNSKTGDINMSYGLKASYAVNKKLKIRSGINKVSMGYNTNNIIAFQSISLNTNSLSQLQNIKSDFNLETVNSTSFVSGENLQAKTSSILLSNVVNTSLNQEFGFIEIPLEIQYNVIDKKFGLNVIGGFSSLFLNENNIYSESGNTRTFVGEANNINNVSYSANFGLGLTYKVSKRLDLNMEPIFKYQINTFENTSGNFNPYFIGMYTGFSIKF